jgi:hypothetical protein
MEKVSLDHGALSLAAQSIYRDACKLEGRQTVNFRS